MCYIPKTLHKHLQSQQKAKNPFLCFLRKLFKKRNVLSFVTSQNPFSTDVKALFRFKFIAVSSVLSVPDQFTDLDKLDELGRMEGPKGCRSPTPMKFRSRSQGQRQVAS